MVSLAVGIRVNGIAPDNVVAEWGDEHHGGKGIRDYRFSGWAQNDREARWQLLEQVKAARNELNLVIEDMVAELAGMAK